MEYEKTYDEIMSIDRERERREEVNKSHSDGEDIEREDCKYANPIVTQNGRFDEIQCMFLNNEFNLCGVPCPLTKGVAK